MDNQPGVRSEPGKRKLTPWNTTERGTTFVQFYSSEQGFRDVDRFPAWECHQTPRMGDHVLLHDRVWLVRFFRRRGPYNVQLVMAPTERAIPCLDFSVWKRTVPAGLPAGLLCVRFIGADGRCVVPWYMRHAPQPKETFEFNDGLSSVLGELIDVLTVTWVSPSALVVQLADSVQTKRRDPSPRTLIPPFLERLLWGRKKEGC